MPSTTEIREAVRSSSGIAHRTWGRYELGEPDPGPGGNERVEATIGFLDTVREACDLPAETNYEELQYVLIQLADDLIGEYENPALEPVQAKLRAATVPVRLMIGEWDYERLVHESCRYVQDAVSALIRARDHETPIAPLAVQAAQAVVGDGTTDIVTLNHDTVIERALAEAGLEFADGFIHSSTSDWSWDARAFEATGVRLLKLHGSVTWRREIHGEQRLLRLDGSQSRRPSEVRLDPQLELLAGAHNKVLQYSRGHYGDLQCVFRASLGWADRLVVAGYGFRDKAINGMLIEWMRTRAHHIAIVHPNLGRLREQARPAVRRAWGERENSRRIRLVAKPAEQATWEESRA